MSEAIIILILIVINGIFSMAEIAIVSSNRNRLENESETGDKEALRALNLANKPGNFLSTIQICITTIGIVSGFFAGVSLSKYLHSYLMQFSTISDYSEKLSDVMVVLIITFVSLVIGELVPKRLALLYPEQISKKLSGLMQLLSTLGFPIVWVLSKSTELILLVFGIKKDRQREISVSEEDVTAMIEKGMESGTFEEVEQDIVQRLFFLSDRNVGSLMTSKTDIVTLDINDEDDIEKSLIQYDFINYPVYENEIDNIIGVLNSKKVLSRALAADKIHYRALLTPPLFVHDKLDALKLLEIFKKSQTEFAVVVDEFGGFSGIVTLTDLFEALVGEITGTPDYQSEIVERENNTWLVDGLISFDEFLHYFEIEEVHIHKENDFYTLSGFVMYITRHIPKTGEKFEWLDFSFEVVDMDGLRVDKVLVAKLEKNNNPEEN